MWTSRRPPGAAALLAVVAAVPSSAQRPIVDLVISNAAVLDVRSGRVLPDRTIVVDGGAIVRVDTTSAATSARPRARRTIDARGRLVTPGLVDVHFHSGLLLADSITPTNGAITRLQMTPDSVAAYRRRFARAYLPYGVTAVRDAGSAEKDMPMLLAWARRSAGAPDFFPSGAALVSREAGRVPYQGHVEVSDPAAAVAKVREYHRLGIRDLKLYWRLREPEFAAALGEARRLGMRVTAHVDNRVLTLDRALALGLRSAEHAFTIPLSVMPQQALDSLYAQLPERLEATGSPPVNVRPGAFFLVLPEYWNFLGAESPHLGAFVDRLRRHDAALTPTLHIVAQRLGLTYFSSPVRSPFDDVSAFTARQRERAVAGYRAMASYVRRLHDAGVRLAVGTDVPDPGKAVLSEMLLLHDAGIPMAGVFRIATLHGAAALGMEAHYGVVEAGRRANLVIFDRNPLRDPRALLAPKTVVKDGVVWTPPAAEPRPEARR